MIAISRIAALALFLPLAGCATQQTLQEYEDEIVRLREQQTQMQKQLARAEADRDQALRARDASLQAAPAAEQPVYKELDALGIDYELRGDMMVISLPSAITFASGSADLTDEGQNAVRAVADRLKSDFADGHFWIEGHTDTDQPTRSAFDSNRELSVARAMGVLQYLVGDCGIPDDACVVVGHGEYAPVSGNDSADGKAKNRRVEIAVHRPNSVGQ
ncbi:MAG TPA: OmpA family protein [Planctomycetota bacterium]|nr:OmpA family protein [Planctomycetota bacterium]